MTRLDLELLVQNNPEYFGPTFAQGIIGGSIADRTSFRAPELGHLTREQILHGAAMFILIHGRKPTAPVQILRALQNHFNVSPT